MVRWVIHLQMLHGGIVELMTYNYRKDTHFCRSMVRPKLQFLLFVTFDLSNSVAARRLCVRLLVPRLVSFFDSVNVKVLLFKNAYRVPYRYCLKQTGLLEFHQQYLKLTPETCKEWVEKHWSDYIAFRSCLFEKDICWQNTCQYAAQLPSTLKWRILQTVFLETTQYLLFVLKTHRAVAKAYFKI